MAGERVRDGERLRWRRSGGGCDAGRRGGTEVSGAAEWGGSRVVDVIDVCAGKIGAAAKSKNGCGGEVSEVPGAGRRAEGRNEESRNEGKKPKGDAGGRRKTRDIAGCRGPGVGSQ